MINYPICETPDVLRVVYFVKILINIVKILVPILLIILVSFNCARGVVSGEIKLGDSIKKDINKIITAILIFTIPTVVSFVLEVLDENTDYVSCWANAESEKIEEYQKLWDAAEEERRREEQEKNNGNDIVNGDVNNISKDYESIKKTDNVSVNYYSSSSGKNFTYWLYLPDKITKNLPIIVYLPGLGERGNDYKTGAQTGIAWGPIHEVLHNDYSYDAIIITMQVPADTYVYEFSSSYIELTDKIADEFSADKNKISIMGFSHGCYGILTVINQYPKYFSAVVPVGCSTNNANPSSFIYQPVWTFVGGGDGASTMPSFVKSINSLGGNAKHTVAKNPVHNVFNDSYSILRDEDYNVIDWMISQTKNNSN